MLACECALPSHQAMHSKIHQARFDYVDTCRRVEEDQADAAVNQSTRFRGKRSYWGHRKAP